MHLKLDSLQRLVSQTLVEERLASQLKAEIGRVLGPVVTTEGKLSDVVFAANDRLDVLDRTGRTNGLVWESRVTARWLNHTDPEVRKFAVRVVPERYLSRALSDNNPNVRAAIATRASLPVVREMIRRFPKDDQLRVIFKARRLVEAGLPQPTKEPMGHDPVKGKKAMGDVARTSQVPDLTEGWYRSTAMRLLHEYGQNIEYAWEELAVQRFCASTKATSGVQVDEARLLKTVKKLIEEKEDAVMEKALTETLDWLHLKEDEEMIEEGSLPTLVEVVDPVHELVHARLTPEVYVSAAQKLFKVAENMLPMGIRKYRLGEGNAKQTMVPCVGTLPHSGGFRAIDERALDVFCESWSRRQQQAGEPLRLQWSTHPSAVGRISFSCSLQ